MESNESSDLKRRLQKSYAVIGKLKREIALHRQANDVLAMKNYKVNSDYDAILEVSKSLDSVLKELDEKIASMVSYTTLLKTSKTPRLIELAMLIEQTHDLSRRRQDFSSRDSGLTISAQKSKVRRALTTKRSSTTDSNDTIEKSVDQNRQQSDSQTIANHENSTPPFIDLSSKAQLFEHFVVVGPSLESIGRVQQKLSTIEDSSLSNRLMRRIGTLMTSTSQSKTINLPSLKPIKPADGATTITSQSNSPTVVLKPLTSLSSAFGSAISSTASTVNNVVSSSPVKYRVPLFGTAQEKSGCEDSSLDETTHRSVSDPPDVDAASDNHSTLPAISTQANSSFSSMLPRTLLQKSASAMAGLTTIVRPSTDVTSRDYHSTQSRQPSIDTADDANNIKESSSDRPIVVTVDSNIIADTATTNEQDIPRDNVGDHITIEHNTASAPSTILYRFPKHAEPPPPEIADFCLPLGGKIRKLIRDDAAVIQEILYGHGHSKRNGQCFIFTLDDKSDVADANDDENGTLSGRLYGICVIHSRYLSSAEEGVGPGFGMDVSVCYAFITRFPLFDFFFQVIFDIITTERLQRMEKLSDGVSPDIFPVGTYDYLSEALLNEVLSRLTQETPPMYGGVISFQVSSSLVPIDRVRRRPPMHIAEHFCNSADWALPTLLQWLPIEIIVWSVGLLLCEAKVVIIGAEPGLVSCGVLGLLALLQPLEWVSPIIPTLPLRHIDFIESPVPIVAGVVLDYGSDSGFEEAARILEQSQDDGCVTAVVDMLRRDVYMSSVHSNSLKEFVLPGAEALADKIRDIVSKEITNHSDAASKRRYQSINSDYRLRSIYTSALSRGAEAKEVQMLLIDHISALLAMADDVHVRVHQETIAANQIKRNEVPPSDTKSSPPMMIYFTEDDDDVDDDSNSDEDLNEEMKAKNKANLELLRQYYAPTAEDDSEAIQSRHRSISDLVTSFRGKSVASSGKDGGGSSMGGLFSFISSGTSTASNPPSAPTAASDGRSESPFGVGRATSYYPQGIILLSKEPFEGDNDRFFRRLVATQLYASYAEADLDSVVSDRLSDIDSPNCKVDLDDEKGMTLTSMDVGAVRSPVKKTDNMTRRSGNLTLSLKRSRGSISDSLSVSQSLSKSGEMNDLGQPLHLEVAVDQSAAIDSIDPCDERGKKTHVTNQV